MPKKKLSEAQLEALAKGRKKIHRKIKRGKFKKSNKEYYRRR
jgi:hypothetical protein